VESEGLNEGLNKESEGLNEGIKSLLKAIAKNPGLKAKELSGKLENRSIKTVDVKNVSLRIILGVPNARLSKWSL
jgi:hypothetical protein